MEIENRNSPSESSVRACNCYKVASLTETILDSTLMSNLKDRYALEEQLGWGQFGVIRACSDKLTGEVLACKSISKSRLVTIEDVQSVKLEIEIMTRLSGHPNIVNLRAVYEEEDYVHLLMELCVGGELFHWLENHGRFSEREARTLFRHLMQVVKYCHDNGVVHRDLKPENILLVSKSSSSPIKLADFGLATYIKPGQNLHGTVGSPFYIAPEVLSGGYNQAADVWSAGVILYILLSGVPPFWGKTKSKIFDAVRAANLCFPSSHWDCISASAKNLIAGMLHLDPSKRLTSAEVLAHPWMDNSVEAAEEPQLQEHPVLQLPEVGVGYFSNPYIARIQDYSFSYTSLASGDTRLEQSPAFTCKSSFSSFQPSEETPCSASGRISFSSNSNSNYPEFFSPIPSLPSFTFFSPCTAVEQGNDLLRFKSKASINDRVDSGDTSVVYKHKIEVEWQMDTQRGAAGGTRVPWISSKRNRTIGFGERDQIDAITESVIRWASCTHIPTAPSLRLSLVC